MVKITLRLDKRYRLRDGKYPVKMAVARNGKTLYVPVGLSVNEENWNPIPPNYIKNLPQRKSLNTFLGTQLSQAELAIQELQAKGELKNFDDRQLIEYLSLDRKKQKKEIKEYFKHYASLYIESKTKENTRATYEATIKVIQNFCDYDTLLVKDINKAWIDNFISFLSKGGMAHNTIVLYVSRLRAIYKYARENGAPVDVLPGVPLHMIETRKRSMTVDDLRLLAKGSFTEVQQLYVDIFFLILMMRGINVKDLSLLKADAIKKGRIEYDREKTGKHYDIKVEPEMLQIINKYRGKEYLLRFFDRKKEQGHKMFGKKLSERLRCAAKTVGILEPLSSYYARHSWATLAIELGATMEMVSAGLGHTIGAQVTQVYVAFRQKQVDKLARRVIDYIYEKGEYAPSKAQKNAN